MCVSTNHLWGHAHDDQPVYLSFCGLYRSENVVHSYFPPFFIPFLSFFLFFSFVLSLLKLYGSFSLQIFLVASTFLTSFSLLLCFFFPPYIFTVKVQPGSICKWSHACMIQDVTSSNCCIKYTHIYKDTRAQSVVEAHETSLGAGASPQTQTTHCADHRASVMMGKELMLCVCVFCKAGVWLLYMHVYACLCAAGVCVSSLSSLLCLSVPCVRAIWKLYCRGAAEKQV